MAWMLTVFVFMSLSLNNGGDYKANFIMATNPKITDTFNFGDSLSQLMTINLILKG